MMKTYRGSCHCGAVRFEADIASDPKGNRFCAVRVNCLDRVEPQELIDAPIKYFNMLHDDFESPPAETRHL